MELIELIHTKIIRVVVGPNIHAILFCGLILIDMLIEY